MMGMASGMLQRTAQTAQASLCLAMVSNGPRLASVTIDVVSAVANADADGVDLYLAGGL